ncbi:MAG: VWA domain-containing protein [Bacteroidota bacterium]
MSKTYYKYQLARILTAVLIYEFIFWVLTAVLLFLLGFLNDGSGQPLSFANRGALYLHALLIPIMLVYFYNLYATNAIVNKTSPNLAALIFSPVNSFHSFLRFFFFRNTFVLLVFALAQPVFGTKKVAGTIESMELVIALDISNSMNTKDISPELSRLDISKRALGELLNNLHGEKIGLTLFAGNAFVQLPLTSDYYAAKMFLSDISSDMISSQGTNIAEAIEVAKNMFSEEKTSKAIILVTDGENHETSPDAALKSLKDAKIELSVLGIGTEEGGPVPVNPNRPELGYKKTASGSSVTSKVNPTLIKEIASKGNGSSIVSSSEFPDLRQLLAELSHLKRSRIRDLEFDMKESRYQFPLFAGLICWGFYLFITKRPLRRSE